MGAYNDDVLFIHIPKTGGTSAKRYMAEVLPDLKWPRTATWFMLADGADKVTAEHHEKARATVEGSRLPIGHVPLKDLQRFTGRAPESWDRIIAILRNPFEQQVSQWWFWHTRYAEGDHHPSDIVAGMHSRFGSWLRDPYADYHRWYELQQFEDDEPMKTKPEADPAPRGYYRWWLEVDGEIPPNVVTLKMEEMATTLPAALAPYCDGVMPEVPHVNAGSSILWRKALEAGVRVQPDGEMTGLEYLHDTLALMHRKFVWTFSELQYWPPLEISV